MKIQLEELKHQKDAIQAMVLMKTARIQMQIMYMPTPFLGVPGMKKHI